MTTVAVLQSSYLPWKGYFDIIRAADVFVFYDDVQYTKNDWRNRNLIKTANGTQWITVPVGQNISRLIHQVSIPDSRWQRKHWNAIQQAYSSTPHFDDYARYFEQTYRYETWQSLSALNQQLTRDIASEFLNATTHFRDSREFNLEGDRQERLIQLLRQLGASRYLSGPSAKSYIEEDAFAAHGIQVLWADYAGYPEYPQKYPPFEHGVSIIDLLFNVGPRALDYLKQPQALIA